MQTDPPESLLPEGAVTPQTGTSSHETLAPRHAPVLLDEVRSDEVTAAEKERSAAINDVFQWQRWVKPEKGEGSWETYPLEPYSESREGLFHRLCESSVPLPVVNELRNLDAWVPNAVIILYLCSHKPEAWRHLRPDPGRFMEVIEAWGDVNVPRAKWIEAASLALKIHNAANKTLAIAKGGSGKDSGN